MLAIASAQAGVVPAVVDVSSAWGSHAWGAPAWGAHSWGSPWASPLGLPSLTTSWGSHINPWNVGHLGVASHLGVPGVVSPVLGHGLGHGLGLGHGHDG